MKSIRKTRIIILAVCYLASTCVFATETLSGRKHAEIRLLMSEKAAVLKMISKLLARRDSQDAELTDILAEKMWQRCTNINTDKDDTVAWMGKGIAASKQQKYINVIDHCLNKLTHSKTSNHLNLAKNQLTEGNSEHFEPGKIDWEMYKKMSNQGPKQPDKNILKQHLDSLNAGKPMEEVYQQFGIPDDIIGKSIKTGRVKKVNLYGIGLVFKYHDTGSVTFFPTDNQAAWSVIEATSSNDLYWYNYVGHFIDIKNSISQYRGEDLRMLSREFIRKEARKIPIENHIYKHMADRLASSYSEQDDPTVDGLAFLCELVSRTNNPEYLPILQNVAERAVDSKLKRYADKYADKMDDKINRNEIDSL